MTSPEDMASLSREGLLALVAQLATDNQELRVEVERLTRQSKRQATPFSKRALHQAPHAPRPQAQPGYFLVPLPLRKSPSRQ
jgi:hypothetical protein